MAIIDFTPCHIQHLFTLNSINVRDDDCSCGFEVMFQNKLIGLVSERRARGEIGCGRFQ